MEWTRRSSQRSSRVGRGTFLVGYGGEGRGDVGEPAFGDGVAECGLAGEVAVDAAVADAEGAGDVDDVGFGRPVAAQDVFGRFEDSLGA